MPPSPGGGATAAPCLTAGAGLTGAVRPCRAAVGADGADGQVPGRRQKTRVLGGRSPGGRRRAMRRTRWAATCRGRPSGTPEPAWVRRVRGPGVPRPGCGAASARGRWPARANGRDAGAAPHVPGPASGAAAHGRSALGRGRPQRGPGPSGARRPRGRPVRGREVPHGPEAPHGREALPRAGGTARAEGAARAGGATRARGAVGCRVGGCGPVGAGVERTVAISRRPEHDQ